MNWRDCFVGRELVPTAAIAALTTTETTTITAPKTAVAARRTITLRASKGDGERAPIHLFAIPAVDSCLSFRFRCHFNEAEAT